MNKWIRAYLVLTPTWFVFQSAYQLSIAKYYDAPWNFWVAYFVGCALFSAAVIAIAFVLHHVYRFIRRQI